MWGNVTLLING